MSANAVAGAGARGRIAIGLGAQGGARAASIGYGKRIGDRASFSLGARSAAARKRSTPASASIFKYTDQ